MAWTPNEVGIIEAAVFIPELWSDEVIAAYKANLVMANLVTNFNHTGKKGDTLHLPAPTRGAASAKAAGTVVTTIQNTEGEITISIAQHFEYSRLIEDIAAKQALDSIRMFYTDDAGFALADNVDDALIQLGRGLQGGAAADTYTKGVIGSDGSTLYVDATTNAADITDAGIRCVITTLDNANIPQRDRFFVIPPIMKKDIMGLARFTEQAFVGEVGMANTIRNGRLGNIYGMEVFVSTNCATTTTSSNRVGLIFHKSAFALVTQIDIRVQTQYKQEYLADLLTADTLYGVGELRNDAGVAIVVPGT